jgi:hypothetical protein
MFAARVDPKTISALIPLNANMSFALAPKRAGAECDESKFRSNIEKI